MQIYTLNAGHWIANKLLYSSFLYGTINFLVVEYCIIALHRWWCCWSSNPKRLQILPNCTTGNFIEDGWKNLYLDIEKSRVKIKHCKSYLDWKRSSGHWDFTHQGFWILNWLRLLLDSEDGFRTGCQNVTRKQQMIFFNQRMLLLGSNHFLIVNLIEMISRQMLPPYLLSGIN